MLLAKIFKKIMMVVPLVTNVFVGSEAHATTKAQMGDDTHRDTIAVAEQISCKVQNEETVVGFGCVGVPHYLDDLSDVESNGPPNA